MSKQKTTSVHGIISASLLILATTLEEQGKVHQALDPYLKIIEFYPDTPEVPAAVDKVMEIAEGMRKSGQFHVAMRVYDRLEAASQEENE